MQVPTNASDIHDTRVALRVDNYGNEVFNHYWRRSLYRRYEYTLNELNQPELLLSAESMELKVNPGDATDVRRLNFTWTIQDYTANNIWIAINW